MRPGGEHVPTVVVGGGQAGLVMAYHLRRLGGGFVVLDAAERVGDAWRHRWDSLRLFTAPRYASLPGWPLSLDRTPTKDEMADYLEAYAARFALPVRSGTRVTRLSGSRPGFGLQTESLRGEQRRLTADRVVVATGPYARPRIPALAGGLSADVHQLHAGTYRSPAQLVGDVLVVGAGNSGADIALDAVRAGHRTLLAGRHPGALPIRPDSPAARWVGPLGMAVQRHLLTVDNPVGRAVRRRLTGHSPPLVRHRRRDLRAAGIVGVPRVVSAAGRDVRLADGRELRPGTVVWCTGFGPDLDWVDLPVVGPDGQPRQQRGVAIGVPGMYFLGFEFQYAAASATLQGLDRDARHLCAAVRRADSTRAA